MSALRLSRLRTLTLGDPGGSGPVHLSAASGLARAGKHLYVIADDEHHLAVFADSGAEPGTLVRVIEGDLPQEHGERKRRKPDFESLARLPSWPGSAAGALLALGSCSRPNRCSGVVLPLDGEGVLSGTPRLIDMSPFREGMEARLGRRLNIEGALALGDELHLLHRGNKGDQRNARIRLELAAVIETLQAGRLGASPIRGCDEIHLGEIDGVPLGFTDATALIDGRVVFSAAAEDTPDGYADGVCRGSAIGILDDRARLQRLERVGGARKVEGIDATLDGNVIRALLVTDADDRSAPAELLACEIQP